MERTFTLEYWLDAGWYVGKIREVPGVFSQGTTLQELEANIADAYRLVVAGSIGTVTLRTRFRKRPPIPTRG